MTDKCLSGQRYINSECVWENCIADVPLKGESKCGGYGTCDGEGDHAGCKCSVGLVDSLKCISCTDTSKRPDLLGDGTCKEADCKENEAAFECGKNGYCQSLDRGAGKIVCQCKPAFEGKYCDKCTENYKDSKAAKCDDCKEGYIRVVEGTKANPYTMCYKNDCDPDTTNTLCQVTDTEQTSTCQRQSDIYVCQCEGSRDPKAPHYCKRCLAGFSFRTIQVGDPPADKQVCVESDCWDATMSQECTNSFVGKCVVPESQQAKPSCTCSPLTKAPQSGPNYCSQCSDPNMSIENGCLCTIGYKLTKSPTGVYSCANDGCISETVIANVEGCGDLFTNYSAFLDDKTGEFSIEKYDTKYSQCACAGLGTCTNGQCISCSNSDLDSSKQCAGCTDATKRFKKGTSAQSTYCFEDKCNTAPGVDCAGRGKCQVVANALTCECNDSGLSAQNKCQVCTDPTYIYVEPPAGQEEEEKNEADTMDYAAPRAAAKLEPKCVPDTCTAKTDSKQLCNNKGQCQLFYQEGSTTEVEARCVCGDLIDQCTACPDANQYPQGMQCLPEDCGKVMEGPEGSQIATYCNKHGTCTKLQNSKLYCQCSQQFAGNYCERCNTGYKDFTASDGSIKKCLACDDGYRPMSEGTEGQEQVMCLENTCPEQGCNTGANSDNKCEVKGNQWACACAPGYIDSKTATPKQCRACGKGFKLEKVGENYYCYPSTCTGEVFDPNNPSAEPVKTAECSLRSDVSIVRGVCTKNVQTSTYSCVCNKRFVGAQCELCGYVDLKNNILEDQNMLTQADIDTPGSEMKNEDICKCKEGFRFGDDGTGVQHCLANYCIVTRKACNNEPDKLGDTGTWNQKMECCGIKAGKFDDTKGKREDDYGDLILSDVCQLKNGSYRCLNCGNFSIFSANYKCSVCIDQIEGRAGVKVGSECLEDNCKKTCNDAGVCIRGTDGKGICDCLDDNLAEDSACTRCNAPSGGLLIDKKCRCNYEYYAIIDPTVKNCLDVSKYNETTSTSASAKCVKRDCGTGGECYGHGTCGCQDVEKPGEGEYPIKFACKHCDTGYDLASNCKDCQSGYRKGPVRKTECLLDKCTASTGKLCNNLGTCNLEYRTMGPDKVEVDATQCTCSANAQRMFKGQPDCETCIAGYKMREDSPTCVPNLCYLYDDKGLPRTTKCNNAKQDDDEPNKCSYERAYNKYRCKCANGLYSPESACTDCKENEQAGYQVRDPLNNCECIASKNLKEHPLTRACVPINCRQEGAEKDCNSLGECVPGNEEYECRCSAGEDPRNYCATCLAPAENEDGVLEYYSYPQIVTDEAGDEREICYLNNCERTKLLDDPTQCNGRGKCVQNAATVAYVCECVSGYASATQCKNCADRYELDPETKLCQFVKAKMPAAAYVGIVFGVLLVVGVVLGVVYYRWKSKKIAEENERKITVDRTKTAQQPITVVTI